MFLVAILFALPTNMASAQNAPKPIPFPIVFSDTSCDLEYEKIPLDGGGQFETLIMQPFCVADDEGGIFCGLNEASASVSRAPNPIQGIVRPKIKASASSDSGYSRGEVYDGIQGLSSAQGESTATLASQLKPGKDYVVRVAADLSGSRGDEPVYGYVNCKFRGTKFLSLTIYGDQAGSFGVIGSRRWNGTNELVDGTFQGSDRINANIKLPDNYNPLIDDITVEAYAVVINEHGDFIPSTNTDRNCSLNITVSPVLIEYENVAIGLGIKGNPGRRLHP